jgi:hypothetical protein
MGKGLFLGFRDHGREGVVQQRGSYHGAQKAERRDRKI